MTTVICFDCAHIVFIQPDGLGCCTHCAAMYKVEVTQIRPTKLSGEALKDRQNSNRG
jgi:hypothetical protein